MEAKNIYGIRAPLNSIESDDEISRRRLDMLLIANAEIARQKTIFRSETERVEAESMNHPLGFEKTFAYFGFLLGMLPPASLFFRFASVKVHPGIFVLLIFVNLVTAVVGYFSGQIVGRLVRGLEKSTPTRIALLSPLFGFLWGGVCGGIGGIFIFVIGAFFGVFIGGAVGAVALPIFIAFHLLVKSGDMIDRRHFLPIALGVTLTICSFIFGR